jgi:CHASE2 domain-containing sensor protein/tRNA A-37 threonylcarbamoyl transferase component Bud32
MHVPLSLYNSKYWKWAVKLIKLIGLDIIITIILTLLILSAFYTEWTPTQSLEDKIYDVASNLRDRVSNSPIVIVGIDDESIVNIGRWPWPRRYIAHIIDLLHRYEAKVIGVDLIYSENDFNQGLLELRDIIKNMESDPSLLKNSQLNSLYSSLRDTEKKMDNDAVLSSSIAESKKVVLPLFFMFGSPIDGIGSDIMDYLKQNSVPIPIRKGSILAKEVIPPIPEFSTKALALGHTNVIADADGTVRSEPLLIYYEGRAYPSFGLQMALKYLDYDIKDVSFTNGLKFGNNSISASYNSRMLISFSKSFPYFSFYDVVSNKVPPEIFKDKIVIIALSAVGLDAMQVTPIGANVPTWGIVANVVDNILTGNYIVRPSWAFPIETAVIILFGVFLVVVIPRLKTIYSAIALPIILSVWVGAGLYLFFSYGYWIKIIHPSLLLLLGYIIIVSKEYFYTGEEKEHIETDNIETNTMLGLSFQSQGMLDIAFEKFRDCPVEDEKVKEILYNLGLEFEIKRMFDKAVAVYDHIAKAGSFKDIDERANILRATGETMIMGPSVEERDIIEAVDNVQTKPAIGRYEISKKLGRGVIGAVYMGKDPKINREVAIRTLRYGEIDGEQLEEVKKRFFREAESAGRLSHPNIVTIFDIGEENDMAYIAMELLDGADLTQYCRKINLLPVRDVMKIISSVADALDYAHSIGVVHGNIKPSNIMVLKSRYVKVTDFGIARVVTPSKAQAAVVPNTPSYMSPEQIAGQDVDGRSDLFSLGIVFYELVTGEKPFQGGSSDAIKLNITTSSPIPVRDLVPNLPEPCVAIIDKLLVKNREARYQQEKELVRDLARARSFLS